MKGFPARGEVWLVNCNPARGSEQAGKRPALVIQNDIGNEKASTTIVAAISGSVKIYPMNVKLAPPQGGLIRKKYKYSYWDSLILASALENSCSILYSEDMQHGQVIEDNLKIINPFEISL